MPTSRGMGGRRRLGLVLAVGGAFVLLVAAAALADNYRYRFASADQAAARSAVLLRSDLPMLKRWKGGAVKPDETPQTATDGCNGYLPKESDLVVTGDSETKYSLNGAMIETQATVFRSKGMVETDWKRQPKASEWPKCLRDQWAASGPKGATLVSARILSLPRVGTHQLALEVVFSVTPGVGKQPVRVVSDVVGFSRGRTEIMVGASSLVVSPADIAVTKAISARVAGILDAKLQLHA